MDRLKTIPTENNSLHLLMVPAIATDVLALAPNLREADRNEIKAASGEDPGVALQRALRESKESFAVVTESHQVVALMGVLPSGMVWMLGSDEVKHRTKSLCYHGREIIRRFNLKYHRLWNYVDERNVVHHRWLSWCGFTFSGEAITLSDPNVKFLYFERTGDK